MRCGCGSLSCNIWVCGSSLNKRGNSSCCDCNCSGMMGCSGSCNCSCCVYNVLDEVLVFCENNSGCGSC